MDMEVRYGKMEIDILENLNLVKRMEKESIITQVVIFMKVNIKIIKEKALEYTNGLMEGFIKECGLIILRMDKEYLRMIKLKKIKL